MSTLSIVIPALNEAENLEASVQDILRGLPPALTCDILIFNDGSSDATGAVAEKLAKQFPSIRAFHHHEPMGLGSTYAEGVGLARGKFVMMMPGDNEIQFASLKGALEKLGETDIIIPYTSNPHVRPWGRRVLSKAFTALFNLMFGLKVRYFNGPCIHRTATLRSIPIDTSGFAYMAQILIRLIKSGATYTHTPMTLRARPNGSSKAFVPRNVLSVAQTFLSLIGEVYFSKQVALTPRRYPS